MENREAIRVEDLKEVTGGGMYPVWTDQGMEVWFKCSKCYKYKELILGAGITGGYIEGTFECPECGWKKDFSLSF